MTRRAARRGLIALLAAQAACASPEASRTRGGGRGADVANVGDTVVFHDGAEPYLETPCVTRPVECEGPTPLFGKGWKPD